MTPLALCLSTLVGCLVGSFLPLVNTELVVLSAAALAPRSMILPLILIATVTQMAAKSVLYYAGSGLVRLPHNRYTMRLHAGLAHAERMRGAGSLFLFASATAGLPPFYLTAIGCGAVRLPLQRFLLIGTTGRFLRFSVLVLLPQAVKAFV